MNKSVGLFCFIVSALIVMAGSAFSQDFDLGSLEKRVNEYTVIVDIRVEFSFGMHTSEQTERLLGTIVTEEGLVIFNGSVLSSDVAMSSLAGVTIKSTPTRIEITTLDGTTFPGELVGVDRFTRIGFLQAVTEDHKFTPVKFATDIDFEAGKWLALYTLLPEFVTPSMAVDVGMISAIVTSPDDFPLTVGFSSIEETSIVYNERLQAVGVLGTLMDPMAARRDQNGMLESFQQVGAPLLGVVTGERMVELIADPPKKGEVDRGWLGITLQAFTPEIGQFWGLDLQTGIIVNEIVPGSPADKGGLAVGDIVYEINGEPIEVDKEEKIPFFQRRISRLGPDALVEMAVLRPADQTVDSLRLLITLENAPMAADDAPEYEIEVLEFTIREMVFSDFMANQLDPESFVGVVVSELKQGGLATIGGLRLGDIIQRIGDHEVTNLEDSQDALDLLVADQPSEIVFFVWRHNKTLFVNVKTD